LKCSRDAVALSSSILNIFWKKAIWRCYQRVVSKSRRSQVLGGPKNKRTNTDCKVIEEFYWKWDSESRRVQSPRKWRAVSEQDGLRSVPTAQEHQCSWFARGKQGKEIWVILRSDFGNWLHMWKKRAMIRGTYALPQFGSWWECYLKSNVLEVVLVGTRSPVPHEMICEEAMCSPWPGLGTFPEFLFPVVPPWPTRSLPCSLPSPAIHKRHQGWLTLEHSRVLHSFY
jgi:hypothetical protein